MGETASTSTQPDAGDWAIRYYPFIRKVARRMARRLPYHVSLDDLVSAGVVGLLDCVGRYDRARSERFEAFAEWRIKGAILDELRAADSLTRDMRQHSNTIRSAARRLEAELGRPAEDVELAAALGLEVHAYHALVQKLAGSTVVGLDEAGGIENAAAAGAIADPAGEAERNELRERLAAGIEALPERQRVVLTLYYYEELNLKEIGQVLGVTESRVCQIHTQAVRRLRETLAELREAA